MGIREAFEDEMRRARCGTERAAREAMGDWISELGRWDLFGGLTFDPRRCRHGLRPGSGPCSVERIGGAWVHRRVPVAMASARFESFVRAARKALRRPIEYVAAVECQSSGHAHLHPLLELGGGLQMGDIKALGLLWYENNGYGRFEVPRDVGAVGGYTAKYLLKDGGAGDLLLSEGLRRRFPGFSGSLG